MKAHGDWWVFLTFGFWDGLKRGPFKSREKALESLKPWKRKSGFNSLAAGFTLRLAGPFRTRKEALEANISTCTNVEPLA